ncbi:MAG: rubrerythrin family protein [bacterium]
MRKMTEEDLKSAFAGESQAHVKYMVFSEEAQKEGKPKLANVFRAIAKAELIHAKNHLRVLGGIKKSAENISAAYNGEDYEIEEMYPAFNSVAKFQNEKEAERSIHYALEAEKIHRDIYKKAKELVDSGKDFDGETAYVCPVCGHTHVGPEAPDKCPVCGCSKDKYIKFGA